MALDAFGFVVATGTFSLKKQTLTIEDGSITAFNADVLTLTTTLSGFAGVGASLSQDPVTDVSTVTVVTTNAIGFRLTGATIELAIVQNTTTPANKYLGLEASLTNAALQGIPNLTFVASGSVQVNDGPVAGRLNWTQVTDSGNELTDVDLDIAATVELAASGSVALDAFGFVVAKGTFALAKQTLTINDGSTIGPLLNAPLVWNDSAFLVYAGDINQTTERSFDVDSAGHPVFVMKTVLPGTGACWPNRQSGHVDNADTVNPPRYALVAHRWDGTRGVDSVIDAERDFFNDWVRVRVDKDDAIWVFAGGWPWASPTDMRPRYTVSRDGGTTWQPWTPFLSDTTRLGWFYFSPDLLEPAYVHFAWVASGRIRFVRIQLSDLQPIPGEVTGLAHDKMATSSSPSTAESEAAHTSPSSDRASGKPTKTALSASSSSVTAPSGSTAT